MIIWTGAGILVPVLAVLGFFVSSAISSGIFGEENGTSRWAGYAGLLIGAALVYGLHRFLSRKPPRILIDEETGERVEQGGNHSLFFVPVKY